jgi:hypothetical protein
MVGGHGDSGSTQGVRMARSVVRESRGWQPSGAGLGRVAPVAGVLQKGAKKTKGKGTANLR